MAKFKIWAMAARPKTLPAAVMPVMIGSAMAYRDGGFHALSSLACLFCALMLQIGTNLCNDYFDFKKGADVAGRIGPTRVTQAGLASPEAVKKACFLAFAAAVIASLYLVARGGYPVILIGVLSIASGVLYTGGSKPYGYLGLGEIFVFFFFGPIAVGGTYYVQSLHWNSHAVLAGCGFGSLAVSMLAVNNYRDRESDARTGKRTLAVRMGPAFARAEIVLSIVVAAIIPALLYLQTGRPAILPAFCIVFFAWPTFQRIFAPADGTVLNRVLADTGKLMLIYGFLFSIGWIA